MGKKIVFVDDSATVLMSADMACDELVKKGVIEIFTYNNPLKFLNDLESGKVSYDLLICDVNMPQMNGLELIHKVKQMPEFKSKFAVALTTENSPEIKELGKKIGLNGWLSKPFTNEKLIVSISKILRI